MLFHQFKSWCKISEICKETPYFQPHNAFVNAPYYYEKTDFNMKYYSEDLEILSR